ncbi:hypothetical protein [Pseudosulfitobacter pseudonitzschiae]|uniref:hypothetical protein n=1 Tax=Pseudosulfitobacter pseudonitzschiae TaxID=1402135 RepID=UPI001AF9C6D3|nr:hypothetical protein [Pseudosulfitobacter pseudonitzschiae]MBM1816245.1 hypothetical protein [Pseudosulfitobacter pseudonitzschiae]MBM1833744.1 hypothetical protein [Pseudosulfitobacter pseudonitzschiae]MBM1838610.1 hypothetical protein [Pseudosulfitobacter pseudonitzschiae]MBM1842958.1 hypothetical protein [Pseudosulfitobacter pseudonitzschiae]MBM1847824.1 hypothetical protein [Pseudosulfitobacter pseudonitzschiae]
MSYAEKLQQIRRAIILRYLEDSQDYVSNADIILTVINCTPDGVRAYYTDVIADLRWLETRGYVALSGNDTVVAEALPSGRRIARGEERDPGIARDIPGV